MPSNTLHKTFYKKLLTTPEEVVKHFDLVYVNEVKLSIERIKKNKTFLYQKNGKPLTNKKTIERIKKLVIPPAWKDVKITHLPNGHLQAIGRDEKFRKQYRYHDRWNTIRNQTKFYKMYDFGKVLPNIRTRVDTDLRQRKWTKTKVLALVLKLLEETHIRIGNQHYAKHNKTYGLSTLRTKHVDTYKDKMKFEFIGKKGKEHKVTVKNKKLVKLVNQCEEIPGWELFKYFDEDGVKHTIDSTMINEYLNDISGELFTAKDFRTWSASLIAFETLKEIGVEQDDKQTSKNILTAVDTAAKALGNTRTVTRTYYVHPIILSSYQDHSIKKAFKKANTIVDVIENFSRSETAMLQLIKKFKPQI